ncbi:MAG: imidazoleglycerol-phosphate dehydratase [Candidatus Omnitrophica bacterium]|nr:imidazoleglycerol-phosphate dehydratase [Candidatus Omnitrophota bacterium]
MKKRTALLNRNTTETNITGSLNIDGVGKASISTGIGLLDHMLELFAFHGLFDLEIKAKGDLHIDMHHTNEDIGIELGKAFKKALLDMKGIRRFGFASVPMEKVLANVTVDISGRGLYERKENAGAGPCPEDERGYSLKDADHFFESFAGHMGVNLIISIEPMARDLHATLEPVFKALGVALDQATQIDARKKGIPSTKGIID